MQIKKNGFVVVVLLCFVVVVVVVLYDSVVYLVTYLSTGTFLSFVWFNSLFLSLFPAFISPRSFVSFLQRVML